MAEKSGGWGFRPGSVDREGTISYNYKARENKGRKAAALSCSFF